MCFFYFETGDGEVSTKPNLALALALAQTKPDRPSDPAYLHSLSSLIDQTQRWVKAAQNLFGHTVLPMLVCHLKSGPALSSAVYVHTTPKICLIHALGNPPLGASLFANSEFPPIG